MNEVIKLIRNQLAEIEKDIKFYKSFVDWEKVYLEKVDSLMVRRFYFKKAINKLRGKK